MNPDNDNSDEIVGQAEEVYEDLVQENPGLHIKMNENEGCLEPHYIH